LSPIDSSLTTLPRVAGRGHQGDHPAAVEEAENALAGALDDLVDFALRGRGRGVEHLAPAIAIGRVDTVQEDGVKMRVQSQVAVGTLNDGQGARLAVGKPRSMCAADTTPRLCP